MWAAQMACKKGVLQAGRTVLKSVDLLVVSLENCQAANWADHSVEWKVGKWAQRPADLKVALWVVRWAGR